MADTAATTRRINRALHDLGLSALGFRAIDGDQFDGSDGVLITPTFVTSVEAFKLANVLEDIVERLPEPAPVPIHPGQQSLF